MQASHNPTTERRRIPGHYDGLLFLSFIATASAATFPWLRRGFLPDSRFALVACGLFCGWFILLDLWVLLSHQSLVRRISGGLGWSLPTAVALAVNFNQAHQRVGDSGCNIADDGSHVWMFLAIRFLIVTGVVALGFAVRLLPWRIVDCHDVAEIRRLRISDIMILTLCCGLALAATQYAMHVSQENSPDRLIKFATFELAPLLIVLLPCTFVACLWRPLERHLFWVVPLVGFLTAYFALPFARAIWERIHFDGAPFYNEGHLLLITSCVLFSAIGLAWARSQGTQLRSHRAPPTQPRPYSAWRPFSTACLTAAFFAYFALHFTYDIAVVLPHRDGNWATARQVRSASRAIGRQPSFYGGSSVRWQFPSESEPPNHECRISTGSYDFRIENASRLADAVSLLDLPSVESLHINKSDIDTDLLGVFGGHTSIDSVSLEGACDPKHLEAFLQGKAIQNLQINPITPESATAIRQGNVENLSFASAQRQLANPELLDALRHIPTINMQLMVNHPNDLNLRGFDKLRSLSLFDADITQHVANELLACPSLKYLEFDGCRFDSAAVKQMAQLSAETITIRCKNEEHLPLEELSTWADRKTLRRLKLSAPIITDDFAARFNLRRGVICCEAIDPTFRRNESPYDAQVDSALQLARDQYGLDTALEMLAHRCVRDESGRIKELNLQWLRIDQKLSGEIGKLPGLRELRFSAPSYPGYGGSPIGTWTIDQTKQDLFRLFQQRKLTRLELPTEFIDDDVMRAIGELSNLRRLQLPTVLADIATPEHIPMPIELSQYRDIMKQTRELRRQRFLERYYYLSRPPFGLGRTRLTSVGLNHIADLKELEYLFVPGFMIDATSLPTILGFTNLTQLHAPFSEFDAETLKALATLSNLQSLTIGLYTDQLPHLRHLQAITNLGVLQLFVYTKQASDSERADVETQVQQLFTDKELHIHYLLYTP